MNGFSGKEGCNGRLKAATVSDILYPFSLGHFIFIREKSGKLFLKVVCGNHVCGQGVDYI